MKNDLNQKKSLKKTPEKKNSTKFSQVEVIHEDILWVEYKENLACSGGNGKLHVFANPPKTNNPLEEKHSYKIQ